MSLKNTLYGFLFFSLLFSCTQAATFNVVNQCSYTVWAAASPGGGQHLDPGQTWTFNVTFGTKDGRVWGRTNCNFNASGHGSCQSGDCNGLLQCTGYGSPPNTLAEYTLNQYQNLDFIHISNVEGFNIPMDFSPTGGCSRGIQCADTSILDECPNLLKVEGGCNNPCTVVRTNDYCCKGGPGTCGPTDYSKFFKNKCPDAYSYPQDNQTSTFTCPGGTNYQVTFCP